MGLSSSSSTQKENSTSSGTQTATTTPTAPSWFSTGLENMVGGINNFASADPNSFVAPASPLQNQAFDNASNLGGWQGNNNAAANMAQNVGNAGANLMPGAAGYSAAQLGPAAQQSATGANSASMLDNLNSYMSPYTHNVVDTTMADFDHNAGQQQAALEAQGARSGAFGGSRFGIEGANLTDNLARARASTEAGLLNQGFNTAAGLSQSDAANRQQANLFNANASNIASGNNASASNNFSLANVGAQNQAAQYGAGAQNAMEQFNAQQQEAGLNRQLGAANDLNTFGNNYATNTQNDLATMNDLGGAQRNIEQGQDLAPLAQLQSVGSLFGATPWQAFTGQTVNGTNTGTSNGTTTTTQSPNLFNMLMQNAQNAARAAAAGGG